MAKREIKGFAGMLNLRTRSNVWLYGVNLEQKDTVQIESKGGRKWTGEIKAKVQRTSDDAKCRASMKLETDKAPVIDEDIADLTVTVGPTVGFPGPEAGEIIVTNVVIDGP